MTSPLRSSSSAASSASPDFSVIVVTWKGDDLLADCLDSIARVYGDTPEVVVVDNAGEPSTRALVSRRPNATYVAAHANLGFAGGNVLGWRRATRDYVVLLNNDTVLTGDSVTPLVAYLDSHPTCAVAQGTLVFADRQDLTDGTGMWFSPLGVLASEGFLEPLDAAPKSAREVFAVGGAFCVLRRAAVEDVGRLFYPHFRSYYEEVDLCHRLWRRGWECAYVPTPPVLHRHSATAARVGWEGVRARYYRNVWFSTLTCFGLAGILRFAPVLALLCLGQGVAAALRGGGAGVLRTHLGNALWLWRKRRYVAAVRARVQSGAARGDREVLGLAVRRQPWRYYLGLVRRG